MKSDSLRPPPARKRWGQNFIVDQQLIRHIVQSIDPQPEEDFLEIGPGHGEVTFPLAEKVRSVTAVEVDPLLVADLQRRIPPNVNLILEDFMASDMAMVLAAHPRIYSSLPYYLSSPILFRLLAHRKGWKDAHVILQQEVAHRIVSAAGQKIYGRLSVMLQAYADVRKVFDIPASAFRPRPKVGSTLIRIIPHHEESLITNDVLFAAVVRQAFGQRRKLLSNALAKFNAGSFLIQLDYHKRRAEELTVEEFIKLANLLASAGTIDTPPSP